MSRRHLWKTKFSKIPKFLLALVLIIGWIFSGWPQIWQNLLFPPKLKEAYALNKLANPHFATDASGWTITNGTGTDTCSAQTTTAQTSFSTSTYDGTDGNPSGSFKATSGTGNNIRYKSYIRQSITALNSGGSYDTSGTAKNSYVSGKYAYVADGTSGLQIIDVSNPASSTLISTIDPGDFSEDVNVLGNYAYVAYGYDGLQIIDVSNPASPTSTGAYNTPGLAYDIYVSGQYAYVADQGGAFKSLTFPIRLRRVWLARLPPLMLKAFMLWANTLMWLMAPPALESLIFPIRLLRVWLALKIPLILP